MGHLTSGHLLTGETLEIGLPAQELTLEYLKSYRCPKFGGDAKQTLEIRVER